MPLNIRNIFLLLTALFFVLVRIYYTSDGLLINQCLSWDALGYYFYLPGYFIYDDIKDFTWLPEIFDRYHLPGELYQVRTMPDGSHSGFYGIGVSLLQLPFFLLGHLYAKYTEFPVDGWSRPYQWSIAISGIFYGLCGLWLQWKVLSKYFNTSTVILTLGIIVLGTNFIQYVAIDGSHVHVYGFFVLSFVLYATQKYFESYSISNVIQIGLGVGLAALIRPTDAIIFLVPLFWNGELFRKIRERKNDLLLAVLISVLVFSLQLIYWKMSSGLWWNPPGSKWDFFTPHFEVLFGGAKGWMIYTPLCALFLIALFIPHQHEWQKAVRIFTIVNIWIVCAWYDWRYGGSYSCRALVQGMAVMSLSLAVFLDKIVKQRLKYLFYLICIYFILNNLFQITQYNKGIIKAEGMSWKEYRKIYWKL